MKKVLIVCVILGLVVLVASTAYHQQSQLQRFSLTDPVKQLESSIFPIPSPESPSQSSKIIFGGDLMFDRHIRLRMDEHGADFILEPLQTTFAQYDLVVANLEGPVTDNPSRSAGSAVGSTNNFIFTFDPMIVPLLKKSKIEVVNIGNNHILNFGVNGVIQTKKHLEAQGITYFGDTGTETDSSQRVAMYQLKGLKLGMVNYNEFVTNGYQHALADLEYAVDQADVIVVYTHWGAEYQPIANQVIQEQAHAFIDHGADLVIGSHPHVTQQVEDYHGKRIYYSLGNFVFDQYFSAETKNGWLVGVEISTDGNMNFTQIPILLDSTGQTRLR